MKASLGLPRVWKLVALANVGRMGYDRSRPTFKSNFNAIHELLSYAEDITKPFKLSNLAHLSPLHGVFTEMGP